MSPSTALLRRLVDRRGLQENRCRAVPPARDRSARTADAVFLPSPPLDGLHWERGGRASCLPRGLPGVFVSGCLVGGCAQSDGCKGFHAGGSRGARASRRPAASGWASAQPAVLSVWGVWAVCRLRVGAVAPCGGPWWVSVWWQTVCGRVCGSVCVCGSRQWPGAETGGRVQEQLWRTAVQKKIRKKSGRTSHAARNRRVQAREEEKTGQPRLTPPPKAPLPLHQVQRPLPVPIGLHPAYP